MKIYCKCVILIFIRFFRNLVQISDLFFKIIRSDQDIHSQQILAPIYLLLQAHFVAITVDMIYIVEVHKWI